MRIAYPTVIGEGEAVLAAAERRLRGRPVAVRVRMLRLLKTGQAASLAACAPLVGYSPRQLARWWAVYRAGGLAAVTRDGPRLGKVSRLTAVARAGLEEQMRAGRIATLEDVRRYLAEQQGITLKTGRRRHRKADAAAQEAFSAGFRGDA